MYIARTGDLPGRCDEVETPLEMIMKKMSASAGSAQKLD